MEPEFLVVTTTTASADDARRIADELVSRQLAACIQVSGPIRSTYRWQAELRHDDEWNCAIKTTVASYPALETAIQELHPYDEPEIIAVPIIRGSSGYLQWIRNEIACPPE